MEKTVSQIPSIKKTLKKRQHVGLKEERKKIKKAAPIYNSTFLDKPRVEMDHRKQDCRQSQSRRLGV